MVPRIHLLTVVAAVLAIGCTTFTRAMPANVVTLEQDFSDFDQVEISHAFSVEINQGPEFSVLIRMNEELAKDLLVVKEGNTVLIGLKPGGNSESFNPTLEAEISMPDLLGLALSGSSQATLKDLELTNPSPTNFYLSGSSQLGGNLEAGTVRFELMGDSSVDLNGSAGYVTVIAAGSSQANLGDFPTVNATVESSGSSQVRVNVIDGLDATASGGSDIIYLGNPNLGINQTAGSATIRPR